MLPDVASIHMAGASAAALDLDFWDKVYGFSYRPVHTLLLEDSLKTAHVAPVDARHLVTAPCCVRTFDLAAMRAADADFSTDFVLEASPSVRFLSPASNIACPKCPLKPRCVKHLVGHHR
jgi:hypothetical protein